MSKTHKDTSKEKESLNSNNSNEEYVARRIKIGGKYYATREKSTSAGQKGTIQGKWRPLRRRRRRKSIWDW